MPAVLTSLYNKITKNIDMGSLKKIIFSKIRVSAILLAAVLLTVPQVLQAKESVTGIVFHDLNGNGVHNEGEPGIEGVLVSNGRDVVATDAEGNYEIKADENAIIFVIKPRGWTTEIDGNGIPRFYYIHSEDGATGTKYDGLNATGPWPESVNFALYPQEESDNFRVVVFGDTQPRDLKEVSYIMHDTVEELVGVDAAFGMTLGDIVFNDLRIFQSINEVVGEIGIPWRHVIGNHDLDHTAKNKWNANGTYYRTYGPSYYAFTWGSAHFIAVDNIRWIVEGDDAYYRTGLGNDQMEFISNMLNRIPDDELVVFMMHIPWVNSTPWEDKEEKEKLFKLLASQPHVVSLAAHTHQHYHDFIGSEEGWPGKKPHHLISMGTICGSWWSGSPDTYGIPHSMMRDGTPTGYGFLHINGNEWKLRYKVSRRPADYQMHISSPNQITSSESAGTEVFANIYNALPKAEVEMRVGKSGAWISMKRVVQPDPVYQAMWKREHEIENPTWRLPGKANPSQHLWKTTLPENLEPGAHTIYIRAKDRWATYKGRRIIRVVP